MNFGKLLRGAVDVALDLVQQSTKRACVHERDFGVMNIVSAETSPSDVGVATSARNNLTEKGEQTWEEHGWGRMDVPRCAPADCDPSSLGTSSRLINHITTVSWALRSTAQRGAA